MGFDLVIGFNISRRLPIVWTDICFWKWSASCIVEYSLHVCDTLNRTCVVRRSRAVLHEECNDGHDLFNRTVLGSESSSRLDLTRST